MSNKINKKDYIKILNFYNIKLPTNRKLIKSKADKIISQKLCRCIKKLDIKNEAKSIGICSKSIFNSKGYTRGKFNCKGKQNVTFRRYISLKNKTMKKQ